MTKKVKLEDIAKALDISIVSVSKTLANKGGVSEETKRRFFKLLKKWAISKRLKKKLV